MIEDNVQCIHVVSQYMLLHIVVRLNFYFCAIKVFILLVPRNSFIQYDNTHKLKRTVKSVHLKPPKYTWKHVRQKGKRKGPAYFATTAILARASCQGSKHAGRFRSKIKFLHFFHAAHSQLRPRQKYKFPCISHRYPRLLSSVSLPRDASNNWLRWKPHSATNPFPLPSSYEVCLILSPRSTCVPSIEGYTPSFPGLRSSSSLLGSLSLSLFLSLDLWPSSKIQAAPSRSIEPATWELEGIFLRFAIHVVHYNRLFLRKGDSRRRRGLPFRNTALYLSKQAANDAVRAWRMIVKDRELVRFVSTLSQFLLSFLFRLSFRLFSPFFFFSLLALYISSSSHSFLFLLVLHTLLSLSSELARIRHLHWWWLETSSSKEIPKSFVAEFKLFVMYSQ